MNGTHNRGSLRSARRSGGWMGDRAAGRDGITDRFWVVFVAPNAFYLPTAVRVPD